MSLHTISLILLIKRSCEPCISNYIHSFLSVFHCGNQNQQQEGGGGGGGGGGHFDVVQYWCFDEKVLNRLFVNEKLETL